MPISTDLSGTPGSAIVREAVGATSEGLAFENEGENAGLVHNGETHS